MIASCKAFEHTLGSRGVQSHRKDIARSRRLYNYRTALICHAPYRRGKVVQPNLTFLDGTSFAEAFLTVSLFLGLFTRAGVFVALLVSFQLSLGLAGVWDPAALLNEWEWSYHLMVFLSIAVLGAAPGRVLGLDGLLRPRLAAAADNGSRVARLLLAAT